MALEMASGIKIFVSQNPGVQILWKMVPSQNTSEASEIIASASEILASKLHNEKIKIVSWLQPDPLAILESGHVIAIVHHGGANSFFEACWAGVPQIVLAQWYDTYDFAARAEFLGIGVYGNKSVAPGVEKEELARALKSSIEESVKEKVGRLKEICRSSGGRKGAADTIVGLVRVVEVQ